MYNSILPQRVRAGVICTFFAKNQVNLVQKCKSSPKNCQFGITFSCITKKFHRLTYLFFGDKIKLFKVCAVVAEEGKMTEDGVKLTPLAGRVIINKREAITGSVFLAILLSIFILVLVQAFNVFLFRSIPALFWPLTAVLVVLDAVMCALIFRRALSDAGTSASAAPYTVAYRHDGFFVLCHKSGEREYIPADKIVGVKSSRAKLAFVLNGWAYSGNLNYGKVIFFISDGKNIVKKSVKYVVNCAQAARFIEYTILSKGAVAHFDDEEQTARAV